MTYCTRCGKPSRAAECARCKRLAGVARQIMDLLRGELSSGKLERIQALLERRK